MVLTRLPTPEPSVFSGDALNFLEWSTSFKALIERRCTNTADKLFYLQKYISGEARSVLEGSFFRNDDEAYDQAWETLNTRYGHPFVIQRAFRDKLNNWPKISSRESIKLRQYSDFLTTCSNALPHVKGLQVLNDCEENKKMLQKLPDWVTSRWNRHVTRQLKQTEDYPSFKEFADFIAQEAEIACNPMTYATAPEKSQSTTGVKTYNAAEGSSKESFGSNPVKCMYCEESHSIHKCQKLLGQPVENKKRFIIDNKLCFGCLRRGHNSKDCKKKATCGICKKYHPTPLHEDRPPAEKTSAHAMQAEEANRSPTQAEENTSSLSCYVNRGGYDCSRALAPRHVITGGDYEPYAIKTDLGWSIVGGTPRVVRSTDVTGLCHRISVKELPPLTPASVIRALESDFKDTNPGEKSISQDDIQFLQTLNGRIHQNIDGHLELPLPFKARPQLPDNKQLALVRLRHLKRKLEKNPKFKDDYVRFMEGIFKDGDAERAENEPEKGNVWYIPHQGVYHPRKPDKIRVVFDCSAKYDGTALNDHLLTGPDLTNGLTGVLCRFRKHPIAIMCDVEKMFHRFHVD
ncbi:hypothetical protein SKAU_G00414830 [Synaphobranchus kaupii]|uniref:CCHC-type domain-containing protein n=1 Tax=Synaphobranchus kaupii TaxID=118154 RepID=A0A9Q1E7B0_SYNKA|nr:hypothetical protein SKAU_G00414830 [Synaphobranchus kaupii]